MKRIPEASAPINPLEHSWNKGAFISAALDDLGLNPIEFRVYAHLCRRADDALRCWGSQSNIAQVCGISRKTAGETLKRLEERGLIRRTPRFREDGSQTSDEVTLLGIYSKTPPVTVGYTPPSSELHPPLPESYTPPSLKVTPEGIPEEGIPEEGENLFRQTRVQESLTPPLAGPALSESPQKIVATQSPVLPSIGAAVEKKVTKARPGQPLEVERMLAGMEGLVQTVKERAYQMATPAQKPHLGKAWDNFVQTLDYWRGRHKDDPQRFEAALRYGLEVAANPERYISNERTDSLYRYALAVVRNRADELKAEPKPAPAKPEPAVARMEQRWIASKLEPGVEELWQIQVMSNGREIPVQLLDIREVSSAAD